MDLISVVVPVYKVEQYLDKCIRSIVEQTYTNLEIILVEDGSPDNCPQICDKWEVVDKRIKVVHIENGGAGRARNIGVSMATGKFITFVDSDDYISRFMYERLMDLFDESIDIVECDYVSTSGDEITFHKSTIDDTLVVTAVEALEEHILNRNFKQIIWNKIYRKECLEKISFPVGKTIDDEYWTYQVIGNARKLIHCDDILYAYRQQEQSIMHAPFSIQRLQALEAKSLRLDYIRKKYDDIAYLAKIDLWKTCLYMGQMSLRFLSKEACYKAFQVIEEVMRRYPIEKDDFRDTKIMHRIWIAIAKYSVKMVCRVRNIMNIGM